MITYEGSRNHRLVETGHSKSRIQLAEDHLPLGDLEALEAQ